MIYFSGSMMEASDGLLSLVLVGGSYQLHFRLVVEVKLLCLQYRLSFIHQQLAVVGMIIVMD